MFKAFPSLPQSEVSLVVVVEIIEVRGRDRGNGRRKVQRQCPALPESPEGNCGQPSYLYDKLTAITADVFLHDK